jgi:DME family drug/metabolite transporter
MQRFLPYRSARAGLFLVMLASVLWGTGNVFAKTIYDLAETNAFSVAFLRMALSLPALLLVCWLTLGRQMWRFQVQDLPLMLTTGSLVALYQVAFYASLPRIAVSIATVLALCSAPVLVALLSLLITRERPTKPTILALICALLGTLLLVNLQRDEMQTDLLGAGLALLAGLLYALNILVSRSLGGRAQAHPLQTALVGFAFGAVILFLIALNAGLVLTYPLGGWLRLAYLGVGPTAIGYGIYYWGMRTTNAAAASIATLLEPLTSALIAAIWLNEPLSPQALMGAALLMTAMGVLALTRR